MSQTVSLDVEFDGNIDRLAELVRCGAAFRYNGRPLPLQNVIVQGDVMIVVFAHRPLIVDLGRAIVALRNCDSVRLNMRFVR